MSDDDKPAEDLAEGTLLSHLVELRSRLLKMGGAVIVIFVCLLPFARQITVFAATPMMRALEGDEMVIINALAAIFVPFKLTFMVAIALAMPVILYQVWAFVAPGLYRKEKRFAFPLLATSIVLFYAGIAFVYVVMFPIVFNFLVAFTPEQFTLMPDITPYISFVMMISLVFGLAFEVPVATVLVVWAGLTTPEKMGKARPYVFLMAFVVGMFLTPPDVISQTLLAVPVYLLYEMGLLMARIFTPGREQEKEEATAP